MLGLAPCRSYSETFDPKVVENSLRVGNLSSVRTQKSSRPPLPVGDVNLDGAGGLSSDDAF